MISKRACGFMACWHAGFMVGNAVSGDATSALIMAIIGSLWYTGYRRGGVRV